MMKENRYLKKDPLKGTAILKTYPLGKSNNAERGCICTFVRCSIYDAATQRN